MRIALLNEKIMIQKSVVQSDSIGNRKNAWEDYYSCFATIGGESRNEKSEAGQTIDDVGITFTVRYCNQLVDIVSTGFRVLFRGEIYNILSVDHMNWKKKCLKFRCEKARR
ncbi:phage head closure protein [Coprococcus phoceensis]|uniref:phage head closure protein n=1 Tax=Coprococcus phoceensis TaxID=1870993 RepID=UPI003568803C